MTQINKKITNQTAYDKKVKGPDAHKEDDHTVAKKKDSHGHVNDKDHKFDKQDDAKLSGAKPTDKEDDALDHVIGKKKEANAEQGGATASSNHNHAGATIAGAAIGAVLGPVGAIVGGIAGNAIAEFLSDD